MFKVNRMSPKTCILFVLPREVSERLGGYFSTFGGNPVACAIGLTVLEVGNLLSFVYIPFPMTSRLLPMRS